MKSDGEHDRIERNLGVQPIALRMDECNLKPADLVAVDPARITFKMIARACKGRRLTRPVQARICDAFNRAADTALSVRDLFTYQA